MFMKNVLNSCLRKLPPFAIVSFPRYYLKVGNILLNCECSTYCRTVSIKTDTKKVYSAVKALMPYCLTRAPRHLTAFSCSRSLHTGRVKSEGTNLEGKNDEKRITEDAELQEILKNIAKDFQVTEDGTHENLDYSNNLDKNDISSNLNTNEGNQNNSADMNCTSENQTTYQIDMKSKFKEFSDEDSTIIYGIEEEELGYSIYEEKKSRLHSSTLKRGETGVFDLSELVDVLREENLLDISVIQVPFHVRYADYLVLARAKSPRHSVAVVEYILKLYKMKKNKKDKFLQVEGEKTSKWKAIDMGNIVLHIFLEDLRECYDIETLWLVDSNYDSEQHEKKDPVVDILQEHMDFLNSLQPNTESKAR